MKFRDLFPRAVPTAFALQARVGYNGPGRVIASTLLVLCMIAPRAVQAQTEITDPKRFLFEPMDTRENPVRWALEFNGNLPLVGPELINDGYTVTVRATPSCQMGV